MRIILPNIPTEEARTMLKLETLQERRLKMCQKLFHDLKHNPGNKLHSLLPPPRVLNSNLRNPKTFVNKIARTNRPAKSFINFAIDNLQ
jgi:hypothetical protein